MNIINLIRDKLAAQFFRGWDDSQGKIIVPGDDFSGYNDATLVKDKDGVNTEANILTGKRIVLYDEILDKDQNKIGGHNDSVTDAIKAIAAISPIKGANGSDGANGLDGADGDPGPQGNSAYQVALNNGFVGTEEEWLDSLKGDKGDKGEAGSGGNDSVKLYYRYSEDFDHNNWEVAYIGNGLYFSDSNYIYLSKLAFKSNEFESVIQRKEDFDSIQYGKAFSVNDIDNKTYLEYNVEDVFMGQYVIRISTQYTSALSIGSLSSSIEFVIKPISNEKPVLRSTTVHTAGGSPTTFTASTKKMNGFVNVCDDHYIELTTDALVQTTLDISEWLEKATKGDELNLFLFCENNFYPQPTRVFIGVDGSLADIKRKTFLVSEAYYLGDKIEYIDVPLHRRLKIKHAGTRIFAESHPVFINYPQGDV